MPNEQFTIDIAVILFHTSSNTARCVKYNEQYCSFMLVIVIHLNPKGFLK